MFGAPLEFFDGVVEVYLEGIQHPSLPHNQSPREDKWEGQKQVSDERGGGEAAIKEFSRCNVSLQRKVGVGR